MKYKTTDNVNVRQSPSVTSPKITTIPAGTIVESDEYKWKAVTLPDGTKGFCAADYLEAVATPPAPKWYAPIRNDKFVLTQNFLNADSINYPKTGVHPGVDYGTQGETSVPLYFVCDGEVIESKTNNQYFGNYFFYYVPSVDRTFVYFHLRDTPPAKGNYTGGSECGVAGKTGLAQGVHLHLECLKGKKTSTDRSALFTSAAAVAAAAEDADAFISARLS